MSVSISPNTQHYLDLYTNNLLLTPIKYSEGKVSIFSIQKVSTHVRNQHLEIKNNTRKNKLEKAVELMKGEEKKVQEEEEEGEDSEK
jgi:galactokinase